MALSLAACGGSSTTTTTATDTTTTDTTTTVVATPFTLTPLVDIASESQAANGALASSFRFTSGNDVVNGMSATMASTDTLIDGSTTDVDVLNITGTAATAVTTVNIETVNFNAASGSPTLDASTLSGVKTINVSGTVATTVDNQASSAVVNLDGYTRILTIDETNYSGTTAAGNADVANIGVSGTTHGTTAATQSNITFIADNASVLETVNIASTGTAANDFTVVGGTNVTLAVVNITGATDANVRVSHADITGLTLDASTATGTVSATIDREGATTTATNVNLFNGIDNIILTDSSAPAVGGDGGSLLGLTVGQTVTFASNMNASSLGFSSTAGASDTATVILDNGTAATATSVAQIDVQNVETLTIQSSGFATSTSTTAVNLIDDLIGDASSITVSGDTSLNLDLNIDAPASGSRTVTVDASSNTAFVDMVAAANAKVGYSLTGTAGADILTVNAIGGTLVGGAGADVLTGGAGADTINAGAGNDEVNASGGADTITLGAGKDTIDLDATAPGTTAVAHVIITGDADATATSVAAQDDYIVTVNGQSYKIDVAANSDTGQDITGDFVTAHAAAILADHGVTVTQTAAAATTGLTFTGAATGAQFTASAAFIDNGVSTATGGGVTVSGVLGSSDTQFTVTDFGSTDVIDTVTLSNMGAGGYYEGAVASSTAGTAYGVMVITDQAYATADALEDVIAAKNTYTTDTVDDVLVVFLNSTTGKAEAFIDGSIDSGETIVAADKVITFDNITSLTDLAAVMSTESFVI